MGQGKQRCIGDKRKQLGVRTLKATIRLALHWRLKSEQRKKPASRTTASAWIRSSRVCPFPRTLPPRDSTAQWRHGLLPQSCTVSLSTDISQRGCLGGAGQFLHPGILLAPWLVRRLSFIHCCYSWRDSLAYPSQASDDHEREANRMDDAA